MLIRKVRPFTEPVQQAEVYLCVDPQVVEQQRLVGQIEVTSLQIAEDSSFDTDPYNCTGQHCIVDIVKER
jgi:hypothetical protein